MRKVTCLCIAVITFCTAGAQHKITRHFDGAWLESSPETAIYLAEFQKNDGLYDGVVYWEKTNAVYIVAKYKDTTMNSPVGLQKVFYENGVVKDSIFWANDVPRFFYHFYPTGKLNGTLIMPEDGKKPVTMGYDESGKKIRNFIALREAAFKGGNAGWMKYMAKNLSKTLETNVDDTVRVTSIISFVIDESGNVTNVKVKKSSGYKAADNDAVSVISNSPPWENAVQWNEPVNAYRLQPVTYILNASKQKAK